MSTTSSARKKYNRNRIITLQDGSKAVQYRADRVLSNRLGQSRKQCQELLKRKRVHKYLADGELEVVKGPSQKLLMTDKLLLDKTHEVPMPPPILSVYHKPKWVLSVRSDPQNRPCLDASLLPDMHPVGRLDYDTSGLLLFSSQGKLTQRLLHPKHEVEKEYVAVVRGAVVAEQLADQLAAGVTTSAGVHTAHLVSSRVWESSSAEIASYLSAIRSQLPVEYNRTDLAQRGYLRVLLLDDDDDDAERRAGEGVVNPKDNDDSDDDDETFRHAPIPPGLSTVRLTVCEGKYRMVRRILANCGHPVVSLHRETLGGITLGDLPAGATRDLTPDETAWMEGLGVPLQ